MLRGTSSGVDENCMCDRAFTHFEESLSGRSFLRVLRQRVFDEVLKGQRPFHLIFERRRLETRFGHEK